MCSEDCCEYGAFVSVYEAAMLKCHEKINHGHKKQGWFIASVVASIISSEITPMFTAVFILQAFWCLVCFSTTFY